MPPRSNDRSDWHTVSRRHPCPVCEKPDWCRIVGPASDPEVVVCMRTPSDNQRGNGGWLHRLRESFSPSSRRGPAVDTNSLNPGEKGISVDTPVEPPYLSSGPYGNFVAAIAAWNRQIGTPSVVYRYENAQAEPVGLVARWDTPEGKQIRQASRQGDGRWAHRAMRHPKPLYRLPELLAGEPRASATGGTTVYVVEGEKAADALVALGLTATTSAGGSSVAKQTDWTPLAGRDVVLLPDNDKAGTKYRNDVLDLLSALEPQPTVRVVELPGLPEKGDAFDWLANGGTREGLEKLAEATESEVPAPAADEPLLWQPFPIDCLPKRLADFVRSAAQSKVVDPAMVAMPLLAALAGAIGGTRRVLIKPDWAEPCIVWAALVAPSGSGKTPAAAPVLQAIRDRDATAVLTNERLLSEYQEALKRHDVEQKKAKENAPLREKPERPPLVRYHLQDVTPEQLMAVLADNHRGVLLVRDELSALFGGFGRYSDGKGAAERGKYLSIWSAEHLSDDRKVAQSVYVRRPHVSIYGGIQPDVLFKSLGNDDLAAGLPARFLFAWPPERSRRWSDESVPTQLTQEVAQVFDRLFSLGMTTRSTDDAGFVHTEYLATDVPFTDEARQTFRHWINTAHAPLLEDSGGALRAAYAKLPAYVGRLALVLQLSRWAAGEGASNEQVDNASVLRAIRLVEWFASEAARVYQLHSETAANRQLRQLAEWIGRKGGDVTPRDVVRGIRSYQKMGDAEAALESLSPRAMASGICRGPTVAEVVGPDVFNFTRAPLSTQIALTPRKKALVSTGTRAERPGVRAEGTGTRVEVGCRRFPSRPTYRSTARRSERPSAANMAVTSTWPTKMSKPRRPRT